MKSRHLQELPPASVLLQSSFTQKP